MLVLLAVCAHLWGAGQHFLCCSGVLVLCPMLYVMQQAACGYWLLRAEGRAHVSLIYFSTVLYGCLLLGAVWDLPRLNKPALLGFDGDAYGSASDHGPRCF
jgi:hypothetical protein